MAFTLYPARKKAAKKLNFVPWYDIALGVAGAACFFYYAFNFEAMALKATRISSLDVAVAVAGVLIIAEVCRRVVGFPILVVAGAFVAYAFSAGYSDRLYAFLYAGRRHRHADRRLLHLYRALYHSGLFSGKDEYRGILH
jgi:TRAP-type uncharacterized transport system fused permease subunit